MSDTPVEIAKRVVDADEGVRNGMAALRWPDAVALARAVIEAHETPDWADPPAATAAKEKWQAEERARIVELLSIRFPMAADWLVEGP